MSLRSRVLEIQALGKASPNVELERDSDGRVLLFPRGTRILALLVVAMLLLTLLTKVMSRKLESGRGAGAAGGGVAASAAINGTASDVPAFLGEGQYKVFYAPDHNLEVADVQAVDASRRSIDAALYSATARDFCAALVRASRRGVRIRVYRDGEQVQEERQRADASCGADLVQAGIEVRVKVPGRDLMHMKSYAVDGGLLRTGSANLSIGGEKYQDNDAVFLASPTAAKGFQADFEKMWNRSNNSVYGSHE